MALFERKAPFVMGQLIRDFKQYNFNAVDAASILGNIGVECNGFMTLQEVNPTVPGSAGGYGWCQWTGPRRHSFFAWCDRTGQDRDSDAGNYSYLWRELCGHEGEPAYKAIEGIKRATTLRTKTETFMLLFLRPGIPHLNDRVQYAERALAAYNAAHPEGPPVEPPPVELPPVITPPVEPPPVIVEPVEELTESEKAWLKEALGVLSKLSKRV